MRRRTRNLILRAWWQYRPGWASAGSRGPAEAWGNGAQMPPAVATFWIVAVKLCPTVACDSGSASERMSGLAFRPLINR